MSGTPNGQWGRRLTIGSQDAAGGAAAAAAAAAMMGRDMTSPVNMRDENRWKLNAANWQATGVINNLPPRISDGTTPSTKYTSRYAPSMAQLQGMPLRKDGGENIDQEVWARLNEERDAGKAADLALRDVLGSLEAARYAQHGHQHTGRRKIVLTCPDPAPCKPAYSISIFTA